MTETPAATIMSPRVLIPFVVITLIWGSTWIVIKDQLGTVPPTWSVTYRFIIAGTAMFAYAAWKGFPLRIDRKGHLLAAGFGIPQFCLNFNFVYAAEHYITSGLVAVVFALLLVPNTALGWLFLKHRITARFLVGSAIATVGVGLLFVQEMRSTSFDPGTVLIGIGLTLLGVLSASVSNVMQAGEGLRARPIASMLAWGMAYGVLANAIFALIVYGPPVIEYRVGYWLGLFYLGIAASALAFTFYFGIIRAIGPSKAAYSSLLVPIIAMGFSTVFEDYHWSTLAVAGGILALAGLTIALRSRRPA
ncbi:DMT family transporter [Sphingomonas sp. LY54]|uniref:DMT family transporter n=1 Tax=Sphingomonas sp. LY54 TaxID=3095343 RepID=UPI002D7685EE|nr:DMT family transporter [Sphingomonas sp. LY54]WRP27242.1 DMT family transporter [Sphingomonas sp. LY54]